MVIRSVELETVCGVTSALPRNSYPEIAFTGRSNVGKSSLINSLMNRKSLARTSAQPGKTQTLNFYNINGSLYLVDLPGYGYAKSSKEEREAWGDMIARYLTESEVLQAVFLLVDIRHKPTEQDVQMFDWLSYLELDTVVLATKADKLKRSEVSRHLSDIRRGLQADEDVIILPYSSVTMDGRDVVWDMMEQVGENFADEEA